MIRCTHCHREAELVTGREIYPHRPDLARRMFWRCVPCGAYVGCHHPNKRLGFKGTEPLGTLANAELRRARNRAHAAFDPIWRSGEMSRTEAYAWLSGQLGLSIDNTHIALLDLDGCHAVIEVVATWRARAGKGMT